MTGPVGSESQRGGRDGDAPTGRANRLIHESSPYLLQHARNPVDWWPWGREAFEEARRRDVPILLSVGYSTCYWCHVMERECFESDAIAGLMNSRYVCIKLDREEHPDVDDAYMNALLAMTGQGGWPMNCFLTPETLMPFWCGTYFPPEPAMGRPSWPQVLDAIGIAWRDRRAEVLAQSEALADAVAERARPGEPVAVGARHVTDAVGVLLRIFDRQNGGFGRAPKFPQPVFIDLLLEVRELAGDEATRAAIDEAVRGSLDAMARGGVFDQVGGGFHRYSVDEHWLVPHFEKMLYDNAQLASTYLRASEVYSDLWYASIARRTLDYVLAEMSAPSGGFCSAQDAEVDHREGLNYLWTSAEFDEVLGEDSGLAKRVYGLDAGPNFRDPHHPGEPARSVLRLDDRPDRIAAVLGFAESDFAARLERINDRLYKARAGRKQPHRDDKVIAGWNGLMIAALARGGRVLGECRYLDAARAAASFIHREMRRPDGSLIRTARAGVAGADGVLEDYAFLAAGLLELVREDRRDSGGPDPAAWARELLGAAARRFKDASGAYMDSANDASDLFIRPRSAHDGAVPCARTVLLHALLDLAERDPDKELQDEAVEVLASLSSAIAESPVGVANGVRGLFRLLQSAPDRLTAALGPVSDNAPPAAAETEPFSPVEVFANEERITVGPDRPAPLELFIRIAPGYHILAADPGPGAAGLMPFRIGTLAGTGLAAYADYPPGEPYGPGGETRVYKGELQVSIAVELHGAWSGRPLLGVTFQACTDTECLAPATLELDVAVDRA
ncbi:MAG: thioredoxin domain-containing protein [Phycisphaerales bacterium]|nr:thioredoxin domain-containing protein [Phycisphaerales bacterium]